MVVHKDQEMMNMVDNQQSEQKQEDQSAQGHRPSLIEELKTKVHVLFIECGQPHMEQDGAILRLGPELTWPQLKSTLEELWRAIKFRVPQAQRDKLSERFRALPQDYSPGGLQEASDIFDSIYLIMDSMGLGLPTSPLLPLRDEKGIVLIQKWVPPSPIKLKK